MCIVKSKEEGSYLMGRKVKTTRERPMKAEANPRESSLFCEVCNC